MRVLLSLPQVGLGGLHSLAARLASDLNEINFTALVPVEQSGSISEFLTANGIQCLQTESGLIRSPRHGCGVALRSVLHKPGRIAHQVSKAVGHVDLVHCFGLLDIAGPLVSRKLDVPLVQSFNSSIGGPMLHRYGRWRASVADAVLVEGTAVRRIFASEENDAIVFYPAAKPIVPSKEERVRTRTRLGWDLNDFVVSTFSTVSPQKGLDIFLDYADQIARAGWPRGLRLAIIGRTPSGHERLARQLQERTRAMASDFPVSIHIDGSLNANEAYSAMDVLAVTSRFEGVATTTVEAISAGRRVIAHDVGSIADLFNGESHGVLIPPHDGVRFAEAVQFLIGRSGHSEADRTTTVLDLCSPEQLQRAHHKAYRDAIGSYQSRSSRLIDSYR